jgi:hypothetical protein
MPDYNEPPSKRRKKRDKAKEKYQKFGKYLGKHIRSVENRSKKNSNEVNKKK